MTCLIKKEQGSRGHPRHYQHRYIPPCLYSLCGVMVYCDLWCVTFSIRGSEFDSELCHFLCMCDVWYSFPFSLIVRVSVTKELYFLISSSYVLLKFWILLGTMLRQLGKFVNGYLQLATVTISYINFQLKWSPSLQAEHSVWNLNPSYLPLAA